MTRYARNRRQMLHDRAMRGVEARERKRIEQSPEWRDVGGIVTDGCLGVHTIRLLDRGDERHLAVMVDGRHRQARTYRGVLRCVARMVSKQTQQEKA